MNVIPDATLALHHVTFRVPAQRFRTHFSVTRESTFAVVDEFALRLVAVCGTIEPAELANFFGFDSREGVEVLRGLVSRDFLAVPEGRLTLTDNGRALFPQGIGASPRLVDVTPRRDLLRMDLLDFQLVDDAKGDLSLTVGIPLYLPGSFRSSDSPDAVARAFRDQFAAYAKSHGLDRDARLYGISVVEPSTRFEHPIDLKVNLRHGALASIELDLGRDQDSVLGRIVQDWFTDQCKQPADDDGAWKFLYSLLPEVGTRPPSLAQVAAFQSRNYSRDVFGIVGSLSVPAVLETVTQFLDTVAEGPTVSDILCWLPAVSDFWFHSRSSWEAVDILRSAIEGDHMSTATVLALRAPETDACASLRKKRFDEVVKGGSDVPPGVEIVFAPGSWCAVWAWIRGDGPGVPIPIGFVTTRRSIVEHVAGLL